MVTKCAQPAIRLPRPSFRRLLRLWQLHRLRSRRRRATIDLIHASPHLLRDIGAMEGCVVERGR